VNVNYIMAIFDKLNPLKKKDDFPEFSESLGAKSTSVPGPSFDANTAASGLDPVSPALEPTSIPKPSSGPQLNSIQSTLNLLVSKVESMKGSLDGLSQRVSSLEQKHSSERSQPTQPKQTQQPQFNPYQQPAQSQDSQPQEQTQQPTKSDEDEGWHF